MRLLFYVSKLYSLPVVQPLISEAASRKAEIALFVSTKVKKRLPEAFSGVKAYTELKDAVNYNPDFVLSPGNFVDFRLPGMKVELFHGIGIEKPSHYRIRHFFDLYLTSGPVVTDRFKEMQDKHRYFRVVETGWPKMDHIINYDITDIRNRFEIPPGKKVILYAPTHSNTMESAKELLPVIDSVMRSDEVWFCKPHEFMDRELLQSLQNSNFRIIDHYDITPFLHLADVMISDTSSVIYEFMALDKPVVTYKTMSRADKGIDIKSPDELRAALDRSLESPTEFSDMRKRHLQDVNPLLNGSISSGIIELLMSIDPHRPAGTRKKPLNLFRKLQILYHSRFRSGYLR